MTTTLTRRRLLGSTLAGAAAAAIARPGFAASKRLDVICHRVHQLCLTTGAAGDYGGGKSDSEASRDSVPKQ